MQNVGQEKSNTFRNRNKKSLQNHLVNNYQHLFVHSTSDAEVLSCVPEAKDLGQNSALILTTATEMLGRGKKREMRVRDA